MLQKGLQRKSFFLFLKKDCSVKPAQRLCADLPKKLGINASQKMS